MGLLSRHRLWHVAVDAALVALAWLAAFYFRFADVPFAAKYQHLRDDGLPRVLVIKLVVLVAMGVYMRWWRYVSLRDLVALARAVLVAEAAMVLILSLYPPYGHASSHLGVPKSIIAYDLLFTLLGMVGIRAASRLIFERPPAGATFARGAEVLVIGAGDAGRLIVGEMVKGRTAGYTPIGILDDDPKKSGMRLAGIRVLGPISRLPELLAGSPPDEVVIAMPSAAGSVRQSVVDACRRAAVPVKTLPGVNELLSGDPSLVTQLREVQVEDVLGREPVRLDLAAIGGYLTGRVVLVTGAGGSIGSELCRQISRLSPRTLVVCDHSEENLFSIERELDERGISGVVPIIADVKDAVAMHRILAAHHPAILFHAAAYKHVSLMEQNPLEALRNNALATRALAALAREAHVERFVLVSTDKAVNAQTMMGASKALCEWVVEAAGAVESDTRFIAVRFGNVLGSSGSVIPIFRRQIAQGGPLTVTDERMTRFFMTIPEAAQLIVEAGGIGDSGDIFVLDMGDPIRIIDLARDMVRLSGREPGRDVEIRIIGARPGEKLHEELFEADERVERTRHAKLLRARRPPIDPDWLDERLAALAAIVEVGDGEAAVDAVTELLRSPVRVEREAAPADATAS